MKIQKNQSNLSFWLEFSKNCDFEKYSFDYFKLNTKSIFWNAISMREDLSLDFIEEFRDSLSWIELSKKNSDIEFFKQFKDKINWSITMSQGKKFLENQENIRYFADTMDFAALSYSKYITNELVEEYQDEVCWRSIMNNERISPSVKEKFKYKLATK